jgi:hypothetical protein
MHFHDYNSRIWSSTIRAGRDVEYARYDQKPHVSLHSNWITPCIVFYCNNMPELQKLPLLGGTGRLSHGPTRQGYQFVLYNGDIVRGRVKAVHVRHKARNGDNKTKPSSFRLCYLNQPPIACLKLIVNRAQGAPIGDAERKVGELDGTKTKIVCINM